MKISKTTNSKIHSTDFSNLPFGRVFSDHMLICKYKNGSWGESEILPYGPIDMMPGTQVLHYAQSVFEGMKAFKNSDDEVLIFRKEENFKRINKSAERLYIPQIPEDIFMEGLDNLIALDSDWCKKDEEHSLYIRPFIFASGECIKASASDEYTFMIITSPTTRYYPSDINVLVEQHYTRAAKGGVGYTKASGNYASSFYPTKLANARGFTQVIWTDSVEHKYIEESGTMNIWIRINDTLLTPDLSDTILGGFTRESIITLARDNGIKVEERKISVDEVVEAHNNGILKEVFGTGTAVTVAPINSITVGDKKIEIESQINSYASRLKKILQGIQNGSIEDIYGWTSKVNTVVSSQ